ncbi:MAG: hypothetical protein Q9224_005878 [Gallowayella concinna]
MTMDKDGGIEGWARLMGAHLLQGLDSSAKREAVVKEVCEVLQTVISHEEDGSMYLGYGPRQAAEMRSKSTYDIHDRCGIQLCSGWDDEDTA